MLGMSSFQARHKAYEKTTEKFVPSWERGLSPGITIKLDVKRDHLITENKTKNKNGASHEKVFKKSKQV
jgi:hypothetical protein